MLKIALLCGGPSLERGISLNSARSVMNHLHSKEIEIVPIYFDHKKNAYQISRSQLYSNTPSDFDFKLKTLSRPLSQSAFKRLLKTMDLAFPVMHGQFGEDGDIQRLLEKNGTPYVGSPAEACKRCFDKFEANEFIKEQGFYTLPSTVLKSHLKDHKKVVEQFFKEHKIKRAAVKPATGGSSIGVHSVSTAKEALAAAESLFSKRIDTRVVVEPFCTGTEFTVIVLENRFGMPVAILPTEIEMDYKAHQVFDYRKKYLATNQVAYHCPPRFPNEAVERIQIQAEQLFCALGMRDFARFDGWLLPDGNLWFSDFNPISGMEQNSFLFQQSAQIGMSHRDLLKWIVKNACRRYGLKFPEEKEGLKTGNPLHVLFGGKTAERQVSLMSGTNAWLKLRRSAKWNPKPFLLDTTEHVWQLPYGMLLNHTVEEIEENCKKAAQSESRLHELKTRVIEKLAAKKTDLTEPWFLPEKMTLQEFLKKSDHVFIGLHGGIGEDGTLQKMLEDRHIPFNGSGSVASRLCMDKFKTSEALQGLEKEGIFVAPKKLESVAVFKGFTPLQYQRYWKKLVQELGTKNIIVKPHADGCSAGIVRLFTPKDLQVYVGYVQKKATHIPQGEITQQHGMIEMPTEPMQQLLFEKFIITDQPRVIENRLKWKRTTGWIEITMGLMGKKGAMHALNPSLTVALGNVLTLEEKFQGGTGVNITPPPPPFVKKTAVERAKKRMEKVSKVLGFSGYARVDAFMNTVTGELIVIEVNSTPALTPSTVIFHQALAENPSMNPIDFLEKIA